MPTLSPFLPAIVIWSALAAVCAFYIVVWWRTGRDPKRGTIIPRFAAPDGLSPAAVHFVYRRGSAEEATVNAGALGALAELRRRGLVRIEGKDAGLRIRREAAGKPDRDGLQDDLAAFLEALLPPGRDTVDGTAFTAAAAALRAHLTATLWRRVMRTNAGVTLSGLAVLVVAGVATLVVADRVFPGSELGFTLQASFLATVALVMARLMGRSNIRWQRLLAAGLALLSLLAFLAFLVGQSALVGAPDGLPKALAHFGLFLSLPIVGFAGMALMSPTAEGRRLMDEIDGFRMFIAVADAGRHAIDNAPDATADRLDAMMPYAIALHVEAGWVNALASTLPPGLNRRR